MFNLLGWFGWEKVSWFGDRRFKCLQSICALFTDFVGICVPSIQGMTDCPSIARSRAGQTWLSASFDSVSSCHVNFSGHQPMPHSIILNPFCKAIIHWLLRASHAGKGNKTNCGDVFLIAFVAALPDRQKWTYSLNNQIYCIAGLISCLYISSFLQGGQMAFLASLFAS